MSTTALASKVGGSLLLCIACSTEGGSPPLPPPIPQVTASPQVDVPAVETTGSLPPTEPAIDPSDGALQFRVETAEADTIRVRTLDALTIEADEILSSHIQRGTSFLISKDMQFLRLEGNLIEGESLVAHHVRARLIIADEVTGRTIGKLHGTLPWSPPADGAIVQNRCLSHDGNDDNRCAYPRWRPN